MSSDFDFETPDSETTACQMCGTEQTNTTYVDSCSLCQKIGPFCRDCLLHHVMHCEETSEDISYHEACSDCEEDDVDDVPTAEDDDFIASEVDEETIDEET